MSIKSQLNAMQYLARIKPDTFTLRLYMEDKCFYATLNERLFIGTTGVDYQVVLSHIELSSDVLKEA